MEKQEKFIQIGAAALRDPATGDYGPSFPLYMKATDEVIASRQKVIDSIGRIFAEKFKEYQTGCEAEGVVI